MDADLLQALARELALAGIEPLSWLLAWARLVPSLILIPAFGLQAFPLVMRFLFAFMLAAVVAPSLPPIDPGAQPWFVALASELARGAPVAVSVAISVWGASMAGNLIDELRGGPAAPRVLLASDEPTSPLGTLLSLAATVAFFQLGGPARLAEALAAAEPLRQQDLRALALTLARGIQFSVALAGPLLALGPFLELLHTLVARITRPVPTNVVFGPARALALLAVAALLLDRVAAGVVTWMDRTLPAS